MGIPIPGKDGLYIETGPWSWYPHTAFTASTLAPIPLTAFWSNSKFDENLESCSLKHAQPITTKFVCVTVVTCKIFLWSVQHIFTQSTSNFGLISNSIENDNFPWFPFKFDLYTYGTKSFSSSKTAILPYLIYDFSIVSFWDINF